MRVFTLIIFLLATTTLFAQGTRGENPPPPPPPEIPVHADLPIDTVTCYESTSVETLPEFPGGPEALRKYLIDNLNYPSYEKDNAIQGRVYIEFIVDQFGAVINPKVKRSVSKGLDNEAIRLIINMPRWSPGKLNGRPVGVRYIMPINFRLT